MISHDRILSAAALLAAVFLIVAAVPGGSGAPVAVASPADSLALETARGAAKALGQDLMAALTSALAKGGPVEAISFCADSAQARTARFQGEGVAVRRVSARFRNPADAPDSLESAALALLAKRHAAKDLPPELAEVRTAADGTRTLHYLKPIVVAPACLACHGPYDDLDPNVREMIMLNYPKDAATGYKAGDFRGAISVRVRVNEPR